MMTQWVKPQPEIKLGHHVIAKIGKTSVFGILVGYGHTLLVGTDMFLISYIEGKESKTRWVKRKDVQPDLWYKGE